MRAIGSIATLAVAAVVVAGALAAPDVPVSAAGGSTLTAAATKIDVTKAVRAALKKAAAAAKKSPSAAADGAQNAMMTYMRTAGGARAALGASAATTFAAVDAAGKQALGEAAATLKAEAAPSPPVASTGSAAVSAAAAVPGVLSTATVGAFLAAGSAIVANAPRDDTGRAAIPPVDQTTTLAGGATMHLTMTPTLTGSRMQSAVSMTIRIPGPPAYEESATGTMSIDLCPDASGTVPVRITLTGGFSLNGGGSHWSLDMRATGHVGDDGRLATFAVDTTGGMSVTPMTGTPGAPPGQFVEARMGYTSDGSGAIDGGSLTARVTRASSRANGTFAGAVAGFATTMGHLLAYLGLLNAQDLWTKGYCVVISVPEMTDMTDLPSASGTSSRRVPLKEVDTGTTTPFTAVVRHKWEGTELRVPVTAAIATGRVSVTPRSPVRAPARFAYKAPDEKNKDAVVGLETRSRRGIATLTVVFRTRWHEWKVDGVYFDAYHLTGCIADLEQPFTLHADANLAGAIATGTFSMTPSGTAGGTWVYAGTMSGAGGSAPYAGSSRYTLVGAATKAPVLRIDPGSNWTMTFPLPVGGTLPLGAGAHLGSSPANVALEQVNSCP